MSVPHVPGLPGRGKGHVREVFNGDKIQLFELPGAICKTEIKETLCPAKAVKAISRSRHKYSSKCH